MSLSYAAHINGDKVYDIATGYWIEAKQEAAATAGRMTWAVYLYDDTGAFVEKYALSSFPEADKDKWLFAGFDMNITSSAASWRIFAQILPSHSVSLLGSGTSSTLKQYFSGEQGYAINANYAVIDVQPLAVSDNGTYTAPFSKAYSPVTVDVQEQPWQPLEDGYSNFWFELTDDALSPWLNFSAKTKNAVIDWGDGSGEVALDTLTPTHTYSKAGKYVVKVKGVTEIGRQMSTAITALTPYVNVCKAIELSAEAAIGTTYAFCNMYGLEHVVSGTQSNVGRDTFSTCYNLKSVVMPLADVVPVTFLNSCQNLTDVTIGTAYTEIRQSAFNYCRMLKTFTIPSAVTSIDSGAFTACTLLAEIHCLPTTPPTLGTSVFANLPANWLCYVPVGYGEAYKAASGWSAYADHILEEGQTPNRAMLSRLAKKTDTDEDMR